MKLKCIAVDDAPFALELIRLYAGKIPELQLLQTFDDAIAAREFLQKNSVDLLFIDINMPDLSGLDLVKSLERKPLIVFTTAYKNYAYDGFELEALDYLLKPIEFPRFQKAAQKALEVQALKNVRKAELTDSFFVYSEYQAVKINISEIEYIESLRNYLQIHLNNSQPVLTAMSWKKIQEKLPEGKFIRIHRSYMVPVSKVKSLLNKKVLLTSGKVFPVGNSYHEAVQEWKKS